MVALHNSVGTIHHVPVLTREVLTWSCLVNVLQHFSALFLIHIVLSDVHVGG